MVCANKQDKRSLLQKSLLSPLKYGVFYDISVDFIFIVKVMIMDLINLYGFIVLNVKLHSFGSCRRKDMIQFGNSISKIVAKKKNVLVSLLCVYIEEENSVSSLVLSLLSLY